MKRSHASRARVRTRGGAIIVSPSSIPFLPHGTVEQRSDSCGSERGSAADPNHTDTVRITQHVQQNTVYGFN